MRDPTTGSAGAGSGQEEFTGPDEGGDDDSGASSGHDWGKV